MKEIVLKGKQKVFCDNYLANGLNATQAYLDAGYKVKNERAAQSASSRLLSNVMVRDYIAKQLDILEDAKIAKTDEILKTLTRVMRREELEQQAILTKNPTKIKMNGADGGTYEKFAYEENIEVVNLKTKNSDVVRAAETLGKYYTLWTDKIDLQSGDIVVKVGEWDAEDEED